MQKEKIFKIMLVGDTKTGKTSFLTHVKNNSPEKVPQSTSHLAFFTMRISSPETILQIWDTPGIQKYSMQAVGSVNNFSSVLLFIDMTN
jgi:small GTP-binding protein